MKLKSLSNYLVFIMSLMSFGIILTNISFAENGKVEKYYTGAHFSKVYRHPIKLTHETTKEQAEQRGTYYKAIFNEYNRIIRYEKIINRKCFNLFIYEYKENGELASSKGQKC